MVADALVNWDQMEGGDGLIKQLNALLTWAFVTRYNAPADECFHLVLTLPGVQGRVKSEEWEPRMVRFLKERFASRRDIRTREKITDPKVEDRCIRLAPLIIHILENWIPGSSHPPVKDLVSWLEQNEFDLSEG